jgi:uncharacterized protein YkwD
LKENYAAAVTAFKHSLWMAVNSKFSHVGLNGSNTADRLVIVTKIVATSYNENIGVTEG